MAVYGAITEFATQEPLLNAEVLAFDPTDSLHRVTAMVDHQGRYMLGLFEVRNYVIRFDAPGHVPRHVLVEMQGPTDEQWTHGYGLSVDMSLFQEVHGFDLTMDGTPVGKGIYDPISDVFIWDDAHSKAIRSRQKEITKTYKQQVGR